MAVFRLDFELKKEKRLSKMVWLCVEGGGTTTERIATPFCECENGKRFPPTADFLDVMRD
jgi:hypothetical protein